jgi:hypothetical protein
VELDKNLINNYKSTAHWFLPGNLSFIKLTYFFCIHILYRNANCDVSQMIWIGEWEWKPLHCGGKCALGMLVELATKTSF